MIECNFSDIFAENPDPEIKDDDVNVSPDVEVSEENIEKANEIRAQAIGQYAEGNYEKAVELFTEAIKLNPGHYLSISLNYL